MKLCISFLVALSACSTLLAAANGQCVTTNGVTCLTKAQTASRRDTFKGAVGPCGDLWNDGTPYCYTDDATGNSDGCDCTKCNCNMTDMGVTYGVVFTGYGNPTASATSATCTLQPPVPSCDADKATYCALSKNSSVCKYCGVAANCTNICSKGLTLAAKQEIVTAHNNYRRQVALGQETRGTPGPQNSATNMIELVWDTELEKVAQVWIEQCVDGHDVDGMTPLNLGGVGQNWAGGPMGDTVNYTTFVQMWYDEVEFFPKGNNMPWSTNGAPKETGHYTQLAWAGSQKVGCGFMYRSAGQYLVCNYWPAGNMGGGTVYQTGAAASACPKGTIANNGLCTQQSN